MAENLELADRKLHNPHRTALEISQWLETAIPEIMTFASKDSTQDLKNKEPYFDEYGLANFQEFLEQTKLMTIIQSGQYNTRTYVHDIPVLLNEGLVDGRYRWLYEVPVAVSYMDRSVDNYEEAEAVNQYFSLTVQVGRVYAEQADNEHHLLFESWSGKVIKKKK